jgi:hypothetical protein
MANFLKLLKTCIWGRIVFQQTILIVRAKSSVFFNTLLFNLRANTMGIIELLIGSKKTQGGNI